MSPKKSIVEDISLTDRSALGRNEFIPLLIL